MGSRLDLQALLESLFEEEPSVHYQPPPNIDMVYPAIRYARNDIGNQFANDSIYIQHVEYEITVIDEDPDSVLVSKVLTLPLCRFNRHYVVDGLNHDVYLINY